MKTNYHTHTHRCGHAKNNEEEMVIEAINQKFDILGFSCHIPLQYFRTLNFIGMFKKMTYTQFRKNIYLLFKGGPFIRMPYYQSKKHIKVVRILKEKYKNNIQLYQGYEAEYLPHYLNYYQKLLSTNKVDYLILGNHFNKYCLEHTYFGNALSDDEVRQYGDQVLKAMDTNLFSYVAHPDLYMNRTLEFTDTCRQVAIDICKKSIETNTPLEINGGGYRRGIQQIGDRKRLTYPLDDFWSIAGNMNVTGIIGVDAHGIDEYNKKDYDALIDFAKKHNIQLINELEFKKGK